jgi:hypothetical protein
MRGRIAVNRVPKITRVAQVRIMPFLRSANPTMTVTIIAAPGAVT